jgi:hypothetical protein
MKIVKTTLLLSVLILIANPVQGQGFALGYQYAFSGEYYSGYAMTYDLIGPIGVYMNFYGLGVYDYADYDDPWPGDELQFVLDKDYWAAQSFGITLRLLPGFYAYGGYCNGKYISVKESTWYDETYILSYDGFYTTQEWTRNNRPGLDVGLCISPFTYFGFIVGYNFSLNAPVVGFNTSFYF